MIFLGFTNVLRHLCYVGLQKDIERSTTATFYYERDTQLNDLVMELL